MGCCDKSRTYRKASGLETELANAFTRGEIVELDKLVKAGGCPAGQHKHAPYDYCHPSKRKHHGYTDEEPSGGIDAAHGVLDTAIVEAKASGAEGVAQLLGNAKRLLDPGRRNPVGAAIALSDMADKLLDTASRYGKSPNMRVRAQAMYLKKIEKVIRSAAKKVAEEKPRMGGGATPGEQGEQAGRREAEGNEQRLDEPAPPRGQGTPTARDETPDPYGPQAPETQAPGTRHPGRGKKVLDQLKGRIKEVDKRAKNAPPGSRARARAKASLQSLKEIEKKVRAQIEQQEGATGAPKPDADVHRMEDDDLADKLKRLKNFQSTKGGGLDKETYIMINDRLEVMMDEARKRGLKGYGHAGPSLGPRH